jgi:RNA polymerase subunit RPABC4/transcription elongation factor Spt4
MNIHTNPSQQNQRLNALYGAYAPQTPSPYPGHDQTSQYVRSSREFYQSGNVVQGFNQSGRSGKEFNQSEKNIQDFNQSGAASPDIQQSEDGTPNKKVLHRVHSCPSCSLLYSESQEGCPSCTGKLNPAQQQQLLNGQDFMAVRALPDPPRVQNTAARDKNTAARDKNTTARDKNMENSEYEAVDDLLEWSCEHCTFANPLSTKVCQVCSKTPADLKKFPKLVEVSLF